MSELTDRDLERYSRQLVLDGWGEEEQLMLRDANVGVVGAGALGSPVAMYLAGAGVGVLGIIDSDDVEVSNLHRQLLHFTPDVGVAKAHSAARKLGFLNPDVQAEAYQVELDELNAAILLGEFDVVVDCTDSFQARYLVNRSCCTLGIPLVEGGVVGFGGLVMSVMPGETACYRCAFPSEPPAASRASCAEAGVLGPVAGVVGSLMALEAMKLVCELPGALLDAFLTVELGASPSFTRVAVERREDCPDCGETL